MLIDGARVHADIEARVTEPSGKTRRVGVEWSNFFGSNEWLQVDLDLA